MISDVESLFHLLLCHLCIFFFADFLIRLFCCNCSFLYILDVNILQDTTCKYFLLFHGLSRPSLGSVLWCTKVVNCDEVRFICFFFCCLCFWCHVQESLAQSNVTRLPPSFSSVGFVVLALMFRSSVHFELILVCGTKVQLHYFAHGYPGLPTSFLEKTFLSPLGIPSVKNQSPWSPLLDILVKNHLTVYVRVTSGLYSVSWSVCLSLGQYNILITVALSLF